MAGKAALANAALLSCPDPNLPVQLVTDASNVTEGATLQQEVNGMVRPIAFFSKKLRPAECRYSTFDRELLAAYLSVRHFKRWLDCKFCVLRTDHRPLVLAFSKATDHWSARQ